MTSTHAWLLLLFLFPLSSSSTLSIRTTTSSGATSPSSSSSGSSSPAHNPAQIVALPAVVATAASRKSAADFAGNVDADLAAAVAQARRVHFKESSGSGADASGEAWHVFWGMRNPFPEALALLRAKSPLEGVRAREVFQVLDVTDVQGDEEGVEVPYEGVHVLRQRVPEHASEDVFTLVQPNASVVSRVDLSHGFRFVEGRRYRVFLRAMDVRAVVGLEAPHLDAVEKVLQSRDQERVRAHWRRVDFSAPSVIEFVASKTSVAPWLREAALDSSPFEPRSVASVRSSGDGPVEFEVQYTEKHCTTSESSQNSVAVPNAIAGLEVALQYIDRNCTGKDYTEWFGEYDETRYNSVAGGIQRIHAKMSDSSFKIYCRPSDCDSNTFAYVYPGDPTYTIHVCGVYFRVSPQLSFDSKPGTLVHEMSHFNSLANTNDYAYGRNGCRGLSPSRATRNADCFEYFIESGFTLCATKDCSTLHSCEECLDPDLPMACGWCSEGGHCGDLTSLCQAPIVHAADECPASVSATGGEGVSVSVSATGDAGESVSVSVSATGDAGESVSVSVSATGDAGESVSVSVSATGDAGESVSVSATGEESATGGDESGEESVSGGDESGESGTGGESGGESATGGESANGGESGESATGGDTGESATGGESGVAGDSPSATADPSPSATGEPTPSATGEATPSATGEPTPLPSCSASTSCGSCTNDAPRWCGWCRFPGGAGVCTSGTPLGATAYRNCTTWSWLEQDCSAKTPSSSAAPHLTPSLVLLGLVCMLTALSIVIA